MMVGTSCPYPCPGTGPEWYARCLHSNRHYDRSKKFVSSLREDRKMRVMKWPSLLGIMNLRKDKNLRNEGLAGKWFLATYSKWLW